jgi:hypothetical protein
MNCEKFQTVVSDLAREQNRVVLIEAGDRAEALEHIVECESCATNWEAERAVGSDLRSLAEHMKSIAAPPRVESNLLAAFREQRNVLPVARSFPAQRRSTPYWAAAIAAALLIVFGIFVVRARMVTQLPPQSVITKDQQKVPQTPSPSLQKDNQGVADYRNPEMPNSDAKAAPRRRSIKVANAPGIKAVPSVASTTAGNSEKASEIATDFYPLAYGSAPTFQEGGQLMRVELPRAAVARFGLPVNMDRTSDRVKADVLVGVDGLAQAIRFVH